MNEENFEKYKIGKRHKEGGKWNQIYSICQLLL